LVYPAVCRARNFTTSFSKNISIIIIAFSSTGILGLFLQNNNCEYFNTSLFSQNYYHNVFAFAAISNVHFVHYVNKALGIEILIPRQWFDINKWNNSLSSTDPNLAQFFSPQNDAQLFVTVYPLPSSNMSLDTYDKLFNMYSNDPTIHNLVLENTTLSGMPAHKATFTLNYSGHSYQVIHMWTIKNNHAYKISFSAYGKTFEKYLSSIRIILDSFNITKNRLS
jgi:serine/threonine-protein kinase